MRELLLDEFHEKTFPEVLDNVATVYTETLPQLHKLAVIGLVLPVSTASRQYCILVKRYLACSVSLSIILVGILYMIYTPTPCRLWKGVQRHEADQVHNQEQIDQRDSQQLDDDHNWGVIHGRNEFWQDCG